MSIIVRVLLIVASCLCLALNTKAQAWNLVWADSFSGFSVNASNWAFEQGANNGWGNFEQQCYTNRTDNALVSNGQLHIIAKQEAYQSSSYTSARMISKNLQTWTYGKIEARIKLPQSQSIWPAFWMLGNNIDQVSWPVCGEIDIMEHVNFDTKIHGTMHWDNSGHVQYGGSVSCNVSQYHVYGIEWGTESLVWTLDGVPYHTANIKNNINNTDAFHKPFFLLLNMAVGGLWPGNPDASSVFPDTMFVDYVNVFQKGATQIGEQTSAPIGPLASIPQATPEKLVAENNSGATLTLQVYNLQGQLVLLRTINAYEKEALTAQQLAAGVYYYVFSNKLQRVACGTISKM